MELYDSLLVVCNTYDQEYFIRIYNKNTGELYKKFLKRGKGPFEMPYCGRISLDLKTRNLWVANYRKNELWAYHMDSLMKKDKVIPCGVVQLPAKFYPVMEFHCYDSMFYLPDLGGGAGFIVLNGEGEETWHIDQIGIPEHRTLAGTELNHTLSSIHPEQNKIITTYRYFDKLVIRDLQGDSYRVIIGPHHLEKDEQLKGDNLTRKEAYFPYYPRTDDHFIYAEYNGFPNQIMDETLGIIRANYGRIIHMFAWNGEPVARLNMDHQLISFVIDSPGNRIIAFAADADIHIVTYDIGEILKELKQNLSNE